MSFKRKLLSIILIILSAIFSVITLITGYLAYLRILLPYNESGRHYHDYVVQDTDTRDVLITFTLLSLLITLILLAVTIITKPKKFSHNKVSSQDRQDTYQT